MDKDTGTRIGWIVLASDAAHLYANIDETRPFPIVFDAGAMVEGYRRLREHAKGGAQTVAAKRISHPDHSHI